MNEPRLSIDATTIRNAIANIKALLKSPNNPAAQSLARVSATTLEGYLPETLKAYEESLQNAQVRSPN